MEAKEPIKVYAVIYQLDIENERCVGVYRSIEDVKAHLEASGLDADIIEVNYAFFLGDELGTKWTRLWEGHDFTVGEMELL